MSIEQENVKYDSKYNLIVIKARTEPSTEDIKQVFKKVLEMSKIENCNNVLLDGTNTKKLPSIIKLYSIGLFMIGHIVKLLKLRIAYVIPEDISYGFRFFKDVSENRGVIVNKFKNVDDAKDWLLNK